jgi:2',3'-cyclic-nucleotide 2'-phosphodiesterase (5'-nucleotidase family)
MTESDIALIHSGTIRYENVIPAGDFSVRSLNTMLPTEDVLVKLEVTGSDLLAALNNGYSKYPGTYGCFLQVSGLRVTVHADEATNPE